MATHFPPASRTVLAADAATRENLVKFADTAEYIHFACHGEFALSDPPNSGLALATGERLTVRDLLDGAIEMRSARLAVLSACQTGLSDFERVPDEAVGLAAGFIRAGVPAVLTTLWPVDDLSTALLVAEFYRLVFAEKLDVAAAMRAAQACIRDMTDKQAHEAAAAIRAALVDTGAPEESVRAVDRGISRAPQTPVSLAPKNLPYADPRYWAGFVLVGR